MVYTWKRHYEGPIPPNEICWCGKGMLEYYESDSDRVWMTEIYLCSRFTCEDEDCKKIFYMIKDEKTMREKIEKEFVETNPINRAKNIKKLEYKQRKEILNKYMDYVKIIDEYNIMDIFSEINERLLKKKPIKRLTNKLEKLKIKLITCLKYGPLYNEFKNNII